MGDRRSPPERLRALVERLERASGNTFDLGLGPVGILLARVNRLRIMRQNAAPDIIQVQTENLLLEIIGELAGDAEPHNLVLRPFGRSRKERDLEIARFCAEHPEEMLDESDLEQFAALAGEET